MPNLDMNIQYVKGIGPKKALQLNALGIYTLKDAIEFFPRNYEDRSSLLKANCARDRCPALFCLTVAGAPATSVIRKNFTITKFMAFDDSGIMQIVYFNDKFTSNKLKIGKEYRFYGMVELCPSGHQLVNPVCEDADDESMTTGRIVPIYPLKQGVFQKDIYKVVDIALTCGSAQEYLPESIVRQYNLMPYSKAICEIHRPSDMESAFLARDRLIFDELFLFACAFKKLKSDMRRSEFVLSDIGTCEFDENLEFKLTDAQNRVIAQSMDDIKAQKLINRLIQGDVGSGKTVVAAKIAYVFAKNRYQTAFMAPTDLLARQHYQNLKAFFDKLGIRCALLTASMKTSEKRQTLDEIKTGIANVVIGTHALISDNVEFRSLALVVADEQHKFGVSTRRELYKKGNCPNIIVMSATPIPRSLALVIYGDLDLSVIDQKPCGRHDVKTYAVSEDMRHRAYGFIRKIIAQGSQAYIVCSAIDGNDDDDLKSVNKYAQELQNGVFKDFKISVLHGKLSAKEKTEIMHDFKDGRIDILVCTTVIEVGIDVKNAIVMLIEDGQRFGLSQLHQMRGRVGRGTKQSYCIVFGIDKGENARKRLKIFAKTQDGFELASYDLKMRGPGDFFGTKQHGEVSFKLADLSNNITQLENALKASEKFFSLDKNDRDKIHDNMKNITKVDL